MLLDRDNDLFSDSPENEDFYEQEEIKAINETSDSRGWRILTAIEDYLKKAQKTEISEEVIKIYWKISLDIERIKGEIR